MDKEKSMCKPLKGYCIALAMFDIENYCTIYFFFEINLKVF